MRARNIKPGFWENERIGNLSHSQRLLFIGLWCLADREGKLEDRPEKINHLLFGYDKKKLDIHRELTVIERWGFIHRYKCTNTPLIMILNFKKHQSPHHTEKKSNLADPDTLPSVNGELTVTHGEYRSDSLNPEPRTLNPDLCASSPNGDSFAPFWEVYPKKKAKRPAFKAWEKLKPDNDLIQKILKAIEVQKTQEDWIEQKGKYIPLPATWLNNRRWEDEISIEIKKEIDPWKQEILEKMKKNQVIESAKT
jgi:hypothetical protein